MVLEVRFPTSKWFIFRSQLSGRHLNLETPPTQFKPAATWLFCCNLIRHYIYNATILNCLQSPVNAAKVVEAFQYEEAHTKFDKANGKRTHFQSVIEKREVNLNA